MSLVLSLKKGRVFHVGGDSFMIEQVYRGVDFVIKHLQSGRRYDVTDKKATEIADDVFVSAGRRQQSSTARVTIDAPGELAVIRGSNPPSVAEPFYETA